MRGKTATWFECKVCYAKTMDDGMERKVTEKYVVDALSFTEAEANIIENMSSCIRGEFDVADIRKASYREVFFSDAPSADRYYKARLQFLAIDEKTEKEKRTNVTYLIHAGTLADAVRNVDEAMRGTMVDYVLNSVAETMVMDVFEHQSRFEREQETGERDIEG